MLFNSTDLDGHLARDFSSAYHKHPAPGQLLPGNIVHGIEPDKPRQFGPASLRPNEKGFFTRDENSLYKRAALDTNQIVKGGSPADISALPVPQAGSLADFEVVMASELELAGASGPHELLR